MQRADALTCARSPVLILFASNSHPSLRMPPPPARRVRGRLALLIIAAACLLLAARAQTPAQPAAAAHSRSLSGLPVATIADNSPFPASSSSAIVVGAGISGLSAADALCAKGFPVTVLEGRARTGGRTFTAKLPLTGATIDVGAGWIHDAVPTRNSVAKFVSDNGIATQTDDEEGLAWLVGGAPPTAAQIATGAQQAAWEATQEDFQDLIGNAEDNWQANLPLQKYYSDWVSSKGLQGDAYEWWNHARFWPGSNAVVMLLGADTAANWEVLDPTLSAADRDRALATRADALFRQLFPNAGTPPVLREYLVTRWNSDPFAYGSYSYMAVGATPGMRTELCATQSDLLWWAGEHCSTVYPSTVQGALDTGVAAAEAAMAKFPAPATGRR